MSDFNLAATDLTNLMILINVKHPNQFVELDVQVYPNLQSISVHFNNKNCKISDCAKWQSIFNLVVKTADKYGLDLVHTGSFNCLANFQGEGFNSPLV